MATSPTFRRAHADRQKEAGSKKIRGTVIVGRFCTCLSLPPDVDPDKDLSDILGGGLEKWDLGLKLMGFPAFKQDGLILQKADVMRADTVGELGNLVFGWYRTDGWEIV